jgi:uncharacterized protein YbjT (DUF2867 family)
MNILLTGANGYIGKRLIPVLIEQGHSVYCCLRDISRFDKSIYPENRIKLVEIDFLEENPPDILPKEIDVAYFLIHAMSSSVSNFETKETVVAENFVSLLNMTHCKHTIYLSGISNSEELSEHLRSRRNVENVLSSATSALTTLRAGIIIGSGSASFEIIRDITEKLPLMITPRWLKSRCQPIAVRNVIEYLTKIPLDERFYGKNFDIGSDDVLTYKEMLLQYADVRGLRRKILALPIMTPRLSSYWLYFITSTSYPLAVNLVNSMKIDVVCGERKIKDMIDLELISYKDAVALAFKKIEQDNVLSSWKDSINSDTKYSHIDKVLKVPEFGTFKDFRRKEVKDISQTMNRLWSIGGDTGWYYADWLWSVRGFLDKVWGGVGLRRGRTNRHEINAGDALDFWRVIVANKERKRLLLYAEMKLPGEAWLEFELIKKDDKTYLQQTATFRPNGLLGRLYWYAVLPFHHFVFDGMASNITK